MQSRVDRNRPLTVLMIRVEDAWMQADIEGLGVRVLKVRHPLPACERIRVTRPIAVLVGPTVRAEDTELIARVAARVGAQLVEVSVAGERAVTHTLRACIDAALTDRAAPSARTG